MIIVHHLNESRSQRILWLLEELGISYDIKHYSRDSETRLAPPELMAVHPLGKSPVITDGDRTIAESGAIVDYIIRRHGGGRLAPTPGTDEHETYLEWLHYAEGSAIVPLLLDLYVQRLGDAGAPLHPRIASQIKLHLDYYALRLGSNDYLVANSFGGADIINSFNIEFARVAGWLHDYPTLNAYVERLHARQAWARALDRGGPYMIGAATGARRT
jgi:glutathione S-transferase